jgi:hypothetical protein
VLGHSAARFSARPLDDDVCGRERDNGVEQAPQDRRATVERQVRDNLEGLSRQWNALRILEADIQLWVPALQALGKIGVDLDGDDTRTGAHERRRQYTGSCTEIENEVAGLNVGSANELRGELATAEKVLAAAATVSRSDGHGRPPCP